MLKVSHAAHSIAPGWHFFECLAFLAAFHPARTRDLFSPFGKGIDLANVRTHVAGTAFHYGPILVAESIRLSADAGE